MSVSVVPDDVAAFLGKGNVERFVKAEERLRGCSSSHALDDDDCRSRLEHLFNHPITPSSDDLIH